MLVVAATKTVAHWALRGHRAVDQIIAQIRIAEGEERWKLMRPYFATVYEDVRDTFEDEPWVDEMTPEDEVEATMAAAEVTHSGLEPELIALAAKYMAKETAYQVLRGVRKTKQIAKLMIEKYGLDHFKRYMQRPFRGVYNQVRSRFEDEPWVDEMTPENEVRSELREAVAEAEDSMTFRKAPPAPEAPTHNEANQAIHVDEAEESDVVDSCDLEDLAFEIGYLVERGVRKAPDVIRAVKEEFGDEWHELKAHFANKYEMARETFRDESWVDEMTPEEGVDLELTSTIQRK